VTEQAAMARAIELAARGLGTTSPNPIVGCVILDASGATVGEGWHERAGGPHAEVAALAVAGDRARGGTAVITLEPCAHTGRTGPCTDALVTAGVHRVVYAVADPNPAMAGGADVLRARGVAVEGGLLAAEAGRSNEAWLHLVRTGRPFVIWKYAAGLDGQVAAADGSSRWITGEPARLDVHRLRSQVDAVAVGVGTVLADDPQLTVRLPDASKPRQPLRVVFDRTGRTPATARVRDDAAETLLTSASPEKALADLRARGVVSVLLEGGPTLAGAFWAAGLIDKVIGYIAPVLLGSGAFPALRDAGIPTIAAAGRLRLDDVTRIGDDLRLTSYPKGR
jgi:diaminohydroxyphosphoribosylaminopyrimidine deaminase/5-amino-6-(5-phosphoribosylamino)uracil reductase